MRPLATIQHALFDQAARTPDAHALRDNQTRLTYRQLVAGVDGVASALFERGVTPGDVVAVQAPRDARTVVTLLGVLAAGAAYLYVDPDEPAARAVPLLADAGATLAIVDETSAREPCGPAAGITTCPIDRLRGATTGSAPRQPGPAGLAYVICTSGSTGRPKAVAVSHEGVVRLVRDQWYVHVGPGDAVLLHSPLSFDASVFEIFGPLLNGGELVIAPPGRLSPAALAGLVHEFGVTVLFLTTALFNVLVDEEPQALHGVRQLLTGGETASAEHIDRARLALPDCRIVHVYGPTETTVFATAYPLAPDRPVTAPVPIGWPIGGAEVHVLDGDTHPVADDTTGELWLGGPGVALGYLGDPATTDAAFVPHLDGVTARRLYRTRDLGFRRADGAIVFAGRIDDQVKISGYRIEPAEVEHALRTMPSVADVVVSARRSPGGENVLVAHVVPRPGHPPLDPATARAHLAALLPHYMVPSRFVTIDRLPLKANGKVDRDRLPDPPAADPPTPDQAGAPATGETSPTWHAVARIWREVLDTDHADPGDDFFVGGGTSLAAARLVARVRRALGVDVPLATLFDDPTLGHLARTVDAAGPHTVAAPSTVPGTPARTAFTVPLSFQQLAILRPERGAGDTSQPVLTVHRLSGPLDVPALRAALDAVVARHDILATRYPDDGEPRGIVAADTDRGWPLETRHRPVTEHEAEIEAMTLDEGLGGLDRARGPLVRARLVTDGRRDHVLGLTVDHVAFDEVSARILTAEIVRGYAEAKGVAPPPGDTVTQYQEFALRQRAHYATPTARAAVTRTIEELRALGFRPSLPLPARAGHDPNTKGPTDIVTRELPAVRSSRSLVRRGVTPYCFALACLGHALSGFVAADGYGVQISQSGRHLPDTDTVMGYVTELAFVGFTRAACADVDTVVEWTRQALHRVVTDPPPIAAALRELRATGHAAEIARLRDRPYLLFDFQQPPKPVWLAPGLSMTEVVPPRRPGTRHDSALIVSMSPASGGGSVSVEFVDGAYPRDLMDSLADAVVASVARLDGWARSW